MEWVQNADSNEEFEEMITEFVESIQNTDDIIIDSSSLFWLPDAPAYARLQFHRDDMTLRWEYNGNTDYGGGAMDVHDISSVREVIDSMIDAIF